MADIAILAAGLTSNQRAIILGNDWDILSRRARTRARNDIRCAGLAYSEGHDLTPLGTALRDHLQGEAK